MIKLLDHDKKKFVFKLKTDGISKASATKISMEIDEDDQAYRFKSSLYNIYDEKISESEELTIKKGYIHTQQTASTEWIIHHNLHKFPSITLVEDRYGNSIEGDPKYIDNNTIKIIFSASIAGKAYLN